MDFVKKTKSERTLESLVAENKELRERVEKLEAQVSAVMDFHKRELEMRISKLAYSNADLANRYYSDGEKISNPSDWFKEKLDYCCPPCFR